MVCILNFTAYFCHSEASVVLIHQILLYSSWCKAVVSRVLQLCKDMLIAECVWEKKTFKL